MSGSDTTSDLLPFPQTAQARLRLALHRLDEALRDQRDAMADFRSAMGDLRTALGGLEQGTLGYRDSLDGLDRGLSVARDAARTLEATAERALTRTS